MVFKLLQMLQTGRLSQAPHWGSQFKLPAMPVVGDFRLRPESRMSLEPLDSGLRRNDESKVNGTAIIQTEHFTRIILRLRWEAKLFCVAIKVSAKVSVEARQRNS